MIVRVLSALSTMAITTLASVTTDAFAADAPSVDQCLAAHERGQTDRLAGKLAAARQSFVECPSTSCPTEIQADCLRWLRQVEGLLGRLEIAEQVGLITVDGEPREPGTLWIEAGLHLVEVKLPDGTTQRETVRVEAGTSQAVTFPPPPATSPSPVTPAPQDATTEQWSAPVVGISLLGLGAASLIGFGVAAGLGTASYSGLEDQGCAPCAPADVDEVDTRFLVADVMLGVGLGLAGAGVIALIVELTVEDDAAVKAGRGGFLVAF